MRRDIGKKIRFAAWSCLLMILSSSCNKNMEGKLEFGSEPKDLGLTANQYKIAYIVVEGAVGTVVGNEATDYGSMPNMAALSLNGVFSWNSVSSENGTLATNYADLLTGTEVSKHRVKDDQLNGNNLAAYPTIFKRIKQYKPSRTALLTSNPLVSTIIESGSLDLNSVFSNDSEVLKAAKEELGKEDVGFMMATFSNVRITGDQSGYGPDNDKYIQALAQFDRQLGEIRKTIIARKNYKNERWLIVVASTNGGKYELNPALQDGSVFAIPERNNFVLMNNPEFSYKLVERMETVDPAWTSSAVTFVSNSTASNQIYGQMSVADGKAFDIDKTKEYTIGFKIKITEFGNLNTTLLGNRTSTSGGEAGWAFLTGTDASENNLSKGSFRFKVANTSIYFSKKLATNTWYAVFARIYKEGDKQYATIYVDGVAGETKEITNSNGIGAGRFQLGYGNGYIEKTQKQLMADVRFYNAALPVDYIKSNYCTTMSTAGSDAYYNNLIGYWPANDRDNIIRDKTGNKRNFNLIGAFAYTSFSERAGNLCPTLPDNLERYVVRTVDAPLMIYNWMNIIEVGQFELDAQSWSPAFSNN
ncbi:LamG-like jellyroll fold domain-containing protein [Sphingobacterium sp. CZ-UAM]|uniref:LamG-like jellyroll fold domain-containing protein n=1 Tax=Sphingobacterium sp. CZ-UAM TaxID=1933868 RepID=UPI0009861429|nr:LamG-like jellyroll fold domain-containing protein [Sphingobacterium sp. CZ-UAM]